MGVGSRFFSKGVGWLGAAFVLGIVMWVAPTSILATERAALIPIEHVTSSSGGGDEEASSTASEGVGESVVTHNQKSGHGEDGGYDPRKNIIAIHDSSSKQYKKKCNDCHSEIHDRQSLDPSIPAAHPAMFPFGAGRPGDDKQCRWCHRTVDLTLGIQEAGKSTGNLRRHVDATLCTLCHGPYRGGPGEQFYQSGLSPTDPDGPVLYGVVCAGCHRELEDSELIGKDAQKIQEAIDHDKGGMGVLTILSTQEIDALAAALEESDGGD
jgi:hypothetical protein